MRIFLVYTSRSMEIPTNFNAFKARGMKALNSVKQAIKGRDFGWLGAFLIYVLITTVIVVCITFSSVINSFQAFGIFKENVYAPRKELAYSDKVESKDESGNYTTTFTLKFSSPEGQTGGMLLFSYPEGCDKDGMESISRGVELKNGITYAVEEYKIHCITKEAITETKNKNLLFELKK